MIYVFLSEAGFRSSLFAQFVVRSSPRIAPTRKLNIDSTILYLFYICICAYNTQN